MNTKINLTYKGESYCLEFNRDTVKLLEQSGFKMEEFLEKPMSNIELVFTAAFIKNHPKIKQTTIDEIYSKCPNKTSLITSLRTMIDECYDSLFVEPSADDEGNASWEVVDLSPKTKA